MNDVTELAQSVANRLGSIDGVVAVALGGAWAEGQAELDADIHLSIYYRDEKRPSVEALRKLAQDLNSSLSAETVSDFWAQGPLMNGGAWLWVEGRRIDWQYRDIDYVQQQIEQCRRGVVTGHYQPGYPHGFFSHYYAGAVHACKPLHDPTGALRALKARTEPYPQPLKAALVKAFAREADLILFTAQQAASAPDLFYTAGCLYRCVGCLVQVLFAVNEQYITHERGAIDAAMRLERRPDHFKEVVHGILAYPGENDSALHDSIGQLRSLVSEIQLEYVKPLNLGV